MDQVLYGEQCLCIARRRFIRSSTTPLPLQDKNGTKQPVAPKRLTGTLTGVCDTDLLPLVVVRLDLATSASAVVCDLARLKVASSPSCNITPTTLRFSAAFYELVCTEYLNFNEPQTEFASQITRCSGHRGAHNTNGRCRNQMHRPHAWRIT